MSKVYLAGPISHLTYEQASEWRIYCEQKLGVDRCLNPMMESDRELVGPDGKFCDGRNLGHNIVTEFFTRDILWVEKADIVLCNFTYIPEQLGGGTIYEMGYAHAKGKTIVTAGPKENVPPFAAEGVNIHFEELSEATSWIKEII